jgi:DNA-binding winged helix-turn-helix (wHTH) protein
MLVNSRSRPTIRFCPFQLDTSGVLWHNGLVVDLKPQALILLELLVERGGQVVTRREAKEKVWPELVGTEEIAEDERTRGRTDDYDDALNHLVEDLRKAMGDDPERPQYVQTIRKKGLKFICPVHEEQVPTSLTSVKTLRPLLIGMGVGVTVCGLIVALSLPMVKGHNNPVLVSDPVVVEKKPILPVITKVSAIRAKNVQQIIIDGSGFGAYAHYVGLGLDSPFLAIVDDTSNWAAGRMTPNNVDEVTLVISNWTDTQIVIDGFSGRYGKNGWKLTPGDKLRVRVWNPQTGAGPAECPVTVGVVGPHLCPKAQ